ncbi:MAG: hypothetical protein Q9163_004406 [Psora crenata]
MNSSRSHPLLAQVPLTVSPFVSLPAAPILPYTYKPLPSTLPPSSTADQNGAERDKYVVASSGHTAHPDEIIASCQALQAHIQKVQDDAEAKIKAWQNQLKEQDLAEKRRVAPGWLDRDEKILEPKRISIANNGNLAEQGRPGENIMDQQDGVQQAGTKTIATPLPAGEELDRAFGGLQVGK